MLNSVYVLLYLLLAVDENASNRTIAKQKNLKLLMQPKLHMKIEIQMIIYH